MLVPKSLDPVARGRKLPVPDARPSEKIAKLFPQTAAAEAKPPEVTSAANTRPVAQPATAAPQAGLRKPRRSRRAVAKPVPLPEPRPKVEAVSTKPASASPAPIPLSSMKRRPSSLIPELPAAAATQARPERRGPRAVGERRQAGQAAAQAAPRLEAAGRAAEAEATPRRNPLLRRGTSRRHESLRRQNRSRRRWRRSAAASGRICRAAGRRSMPGSICTA